MQSTVSMVPLLGLRLKCQTASRIPLDIPLFRVGNLLRQISGQGREFKFSESQKALFEVKRAMGIRTLLIKVLQQLILSDSRVNLHSA